MIPLRYNLAVSPSESPEIIVRNPSFEPRTIRLDPGVITTIGRAIDCTIPIRDRFLSRHHAELVASDQGWVLVDRGSANGTWLNGDRVRETRPLRDGDLIRLGDTEIVFSTQMSTDRLLTVGNLESKPTISIPLDEALEVEVESAGVLTGGSVERLLTLTTLAGDLISEHPSEELFGYILDRILIHLDASRAAIALGAGDGEFTLNEVRRRHADDETELAISKTLLREVMHDKKVVSYVDVAEDEKLSRAHSIVMQGIRSIISAPLVVDERVVGILYVDWVLRRIPISEEDVRLVAQIARFAAMKVETARLREASVAKKIMDEEMKTASAVQAGLLPQKTPDVGGYSFYGRQYPCRTVGGDYFDFIARPDGRIYFIIADISGKGVTAALLMAGLQSAFRIFIRRDPEPANLVEELNEAMIESTPVSRFVTLVAGIVDPSIGVVRYTNAGHVPPIALSSEPKELDQTDLVVGIRSNVRYRTHELKLAPGDSMLLFTDGLSEVESPSGEPFEVETLIRLAPSLRGLEAREIGERVEDLVTDFSAGVPFADDLTMLVISRNAEGERADLASNA